VGENVTLPVQREKHQLARKSGSTDKTSEYQTKVLGEKKRTRWCVVGAVKKMVL